MVTLMRWVRLKLKVAKAPLPTNRGAGKSGMFSASLCCGFFYLQFSACHLVLTPRCCTVKPSTSADPSTQVGLVVWVFFTAVCLMK